MYEPTQGIAKLRIAAFVEATTLLVMLAAMISRWTLGGPDISSIVGPIHGLAFLTYVVMVIFARTDHGWTLWRTAALVLAAVIPFGGYVAGHGIGTSSRDLPTGSAQTQR